MASEKKRDSQAERSRRDVILESYSGVQLIPAVEPR